MEASKKREWELLQDEMRSMVIEEEHLVATWKYVAGMDISFFTNDSRKAIASISVCSWSDPKMPVVWFGHQEISLTEAYCPSFLSFREAPHLIELWGRFKLTCPDIAKETGLILVDGNGVLHPRQFGLASHIGVALNMPTIGVAKTLIHVTGLPSEKEVRTRMLTECLNPGDYISLMGQPEIRRDGAKGCSCLHTCLGVALKATSGSTRPLYVSIGHRMTISDAVRFVLHSCLHRIPEPIRQADLRSREIVAIRQKST